MTMKKFIKENWLKIQHKFNFKNISKIFFVFLYKIFKLKIKLEKKFLPKIKEKIKPFLFFYKKEKFLKIVGLIRCGLKDIRSKIFIFAAFFIVSFISFSYFAIFKLNDVIVGKSILASYFILQFKFIKNARIDFILAALISFIALWIYLFFHLKQNSIKKLLRVYFFSLFFAVMGFGFAYLGARSFAAGDILFERIKISRNHSAENVYWSTDEILNRLKNQNEPPKIIRGEADATKQAILTILDAQQGGTFYKQQILPNTPNLFSYKITSLDDASLIMVNNDLFVRKFDVGVLEAVSPTIAKLMIEKETDQRYVKTDPEMHLMGREEYNKFREDQINIRIAKLDDALTQVTKIVNSYYSAVDYDNSKVNYYVEMASLTLSQGNLAYSSCINAQDCTYNYNPGYFIGYTYISGNSYETCEPRYTYAYCESQRYLYNDEIDQYNNNAADWRVQLGSDQNELAMYSEIKKIIKLYKNMADSSKEDIPFELGVFDPPNNIKVAIDATKVDNLADYFATVVHEYYHYTSYISDEKQLPTFFEEGLTEYFARKAVKDDIGIETNEGYPLIEGVIKRFMEKIPEKEFQDIYFTKDNDLLEKTLDDAYGKDFYKNNEIYFDYISYIPTDKALEITNNLLDKIGASKLTKDDLLSRSSQF